MTEPSAGQPSTEQPSERWRTLEEFTGGMDANRRPSTDRLAGTDLTITFEDGAKVRQRFTDAGTLRLDTADGSGAHRYDAVQIGDDVYFVDFVRAEDPTTSISQLISPRTGWVLQVRSTIGDQVPDTPRVRQAFTVGVLSDATVPPATPRPARTRDLIGRRALYSYSDQHLYEHVYLNGTRYAWQCLRGPQRGHGDVDLADMYAFDTDIYLVCWQEFRIPVACVWAYNLHSDELHTTGKFFGLTGDGTVQNGPAGSHITLLNPAGYPDGVEPA